MDRLTKFILAFALAFLALIIAMGIGNRLASKRKEPISPPEVSIVSKEAKEKEDKTKTVIEEQGEKEQKRLEATREKRTEEMFIPSEERIPPPPYFPDMEAYPETEFTPSSGFEEGLPPEMDPRQAYPPDYIPGEYGEYPEQGMPPEMYPQGEYPPNYPTDEYSEEDVLHEDYAPFPPYSPDYPFEEPALPEEPSENQL